MGENKIRERYGNLFEMYERITGENPYQAPCAFARSCNGRPVGRLPTDVHHFPASS